MTLAAACRHKCLDLRYEILKINIILFRPQIITSVGGNAILISLHCIVPLSLLHGSMNGRFLLKLQQCCAQTQLQQPTEVYPCNVTGSPAWCKGHDQWIYKREKKKTELRTHMAAFQTDILQQLSYSWHCYRCLMLIQGCFCGMLNFLSSCNCYASQSGFFSVASDSWCAFFQASHTCHFTSVDVSLEFQLFVRIMLLPAWLVLGCLLLSILLFTSLIVHKRTCCWASRFCSFLIFKVQKMVKTRR